MRTILAAKARDANHFPKYTLTSEREMRRRLSASRVEDSGFASLATRRNLTPSPPTVPVAPCHKCFATKISHRPVAAYERDTEESRQLLPHMHHGACAVDGARMPTLHGRATLVGQDGSLVDAEVEARRGIRTAPCGSLRGDMPSSHSHHRNKGRSPSSSRSRSPDLHSRSPSWSPLPFDASCSFEEGGEEGGEEGREERAEGAGGGAGGGVTFAASLCAPSMALSAGPGALEMALSAGQGALECGAEKKEDDDDDDDDDEQEEEADGVLLGQGLVPRRADVRIPADYEPALWRLESHYSEQEKLPRLAPASNASPSQRDANVCNALPRVSRTAGRDTERGGGTPIATSRELRYLRGDPIQVPTVLLYPNPPPTAPSATGRPLHRRADYSHGCSRRADHSTSTRVPIPRGPSPRGPRLKAAQLPFPEVADPIDNPYGLILLEEPRRRLAQPPMHLPTTAEAGSMSHRTATGAAGSLARQDSRGVASLLPPPNSRQESRQQSRGRMREHSRELGRQLSSRGSSSIVPSRPSSRFDGSGWGGERGERGDGSMTTTLAALSLSPRRAGFYPPTLMPFAQHDNTPATGSFLHAAIEQRLEARVSSSRGRPREAGDKPIMQRQASSEKIVEQKLRPVAYMQAWPLLDDMQRRR